jgi:hypothetical protein
MMAPQRPGMDGLLEALADEIADRLQARGLLPGANGEPESAAAPTNRPVESDESPPGSDDAASAVSIQAPPSEAGLKAHEDDSSAAGDADSSDDGGHGQSVDVTPLQLPPRYAARLLGRIALLTLVVTVLINIPITRGGLTLATALPDSASLVIRDGLVVKPAESADIYVYQEGAFRWISSLEAFEHYGFRWQQVREVKVDFLDDYEIGAPLHVLLKCPGSPHIYRLEKGVKRWIVDIATFTAEGHVWEDVRVVSCWDLRNYADGETIPPGQGPPPVP